MLKTLLQIVSLCLATVGCGTWGKHNNPHDQTTHEYTVSPSEAPDGASLVGNDANYSSIDHDMKRDSVSTAGRTYFYQRVYAAMGTCRICHAGPSGIPLDTYERVKDKLKQLPQDVNSIDNLLINKSYLSRGESHDSGGLKCESLNASPCLEFQIWYGLER
jgi:hypothetical protein